MESPACLKITPSKLTLEELCVTKTPVEIAENPSENIGNNPEALKKAFPWLSESDNLSTDKCGESKPEPLIGSDVLLTGTESTAELQGITECDIAAAMASFPPAEEILQELDDAISDHDFMLVGNSMLADSEIPLTSADAPIQPISDTTMKEELETTVSPLVESVKNVTLEDENFFIQQNISSDVVGETREEVKADESVSNEKLQDFKAESEPLQTLQRSTTTPEPIRKWREENTKRIKEKEAVEKKEIEELKLQAQQELSDWYARREAIIKTKSEENKVAQSPLDQHSGTVNVWEKVAELCDFNRKGTKSTKDTSRIKSIVLKLKQKPLPPPSIGGLEISGVSDA